MKEQQKYITSLRVAEITGKTHLQVLRDIEFFVKEGELKSEFEKDSFLNDQCVCVVYYRISQLGMSFLIALYHALLVDEANCIWGTSFRDNPLSLELENAQSVDDMWSINKRLHKELLNNPNVKWKLFMSELDKYKVEYKRQIVQQTYLMQDSKSGLYKIGKSQDPVGRLKTLRTGSPYLNLYATCDRDCEHELHKRFKHKNVYSEFFELSDADLELIMEEYEFRIYTSPEPYQEKENKPEAK